MNELQEIHFPGEIKIVSPLERDRIGTLSVRVDGTRKFRIEFNGKEIISAEKKEAKDIMKILVQLGIAGDMHDSTAVEREYFRYRGSNFRLQVDNHWLVVDSELGNNLELEQHYQATNQMSEVGDIGISYLGDKRLRICVNSRSFIRFAPAKNFMLESPEWKCDGRLVDATVKVR